MRFKLAITQKNHSLCLPHIYGRMLLDNLVDSGIRKKSISEMIKTAF